MFSSQLGKLGAVGRKTTIQRAISILRRYGQDAHIYLPGVGMLNGLQAGNYLDSAGTTVGTVDQPVGLVLDAAGGLGVELVVNGDFSNGANWSTGAGFSITGGQLAATSAATASNADQPIVLTAGSTYQITYTVSSYSAGSIQAYFTGGTLAAGVARNANGTITEVIKANSGNTTLRLYVASTFTGSIDNISVREVTGIAASQPTTASKPILRRGAVNLLTYSGDFGNAAWTKASGATIPAIGITDYLGGASAVTVAVPSSAGGGLTQVISTWAAGSNGTGFVYAKRASTGSATAVRLTTNNQVAWNTGVSTKLVLTTQWQIIPLSGVLSTTANCKILIGCSDATGAIDGDCIGNVDVCFAGLFAGTYTAQQIQALGGIPTTLTAPVSTALGAYWWDTSGSKSLVATFPAGNESVTVINATPTGQVTTTAQNVVGAYSINTNTNGRIIVNGVLTAPDLTLLQSLANKMAGL